jgi:Polyketide cyclase / dehydrase and lipid transport
LILIIATRPATFHIERSITAAASPENAFAQVNDFHAWSAWSPWEKLDPQMKRTFEGAPSGTGSVYSWQGNDDVGEGRMTIQKSDKPSLVLIKLEFIKPWTATNTTTFTFAPVTEGTKVTWAMDGENNFMSKAFSLFMNMDKMVGDDFERGLTALKAAAEQAPKANAQAAP